MILRKPYAILIKNFKLIHTIITVCMIYLVYRSYLIYDYIRVFMQTDMLATEKDITGELFNTQMFLFPGIIMTLLIVLLVVMIRKKKPKLFYVLNIGFYGATVVIYSYLYNQLNYIETNISELKEVKLIHDIALILLAIQVISMILSFIRAVGLDIKKFDFGKDLMELDVQEEDNEEFEVSVNVETNVIKRILNKNKRFAKYIYIENKFIIDIFILLAISTIIFLSYMNLNVYNVVYNEGDTFLAGTFNMGVTKSYVTQENYRGVKMTSKDTALLVVEVYIKAPSRNQLFNTAKAEMVVNNNTYFPTKVEYKSAIFDLGKTYYNEEISTEFEKILLVYEIPSKDIEESMQFMYINDIEIKENKLNPKYIRVNLTPINLDEKDDVVDAKLGEAISLNKDTLGTSSLTINSFDMAKEYVLKYKYCINSKECYPSVEYLKPLVNANYNKILLKINATMTIDENIVINNIYSPYSLINYFGILVYKVDGKTYTSNNGFSKVTAYRVATNNDYYLEINENVLKADEIYLLINIRNTQYKYTIK